MQTQQDVEVSGHELHCACQECEAKIINQFQGFASCKFHAKAAGLLRGCGDCGRMIKPRRRRGFLVWSCWQCVHKDAAVTRVIFGESGRPEYGFAVDESDATVYFHLNRQVHIQYDGSDHPGQSDFVNDTESASIHPNDIIIYQEFMGNRGAKALWWAFEAEYYNVLTQIQSRLTYRFVRRDGREAQSRLQVQPKYRVMWEGKDLNSVGMMLPNVINDHDPDAFYACYWQYQDPDDSNVWSVCSDPRTSGD